MKAPSAQSNPSSYQNRRYANVNSNQPSLTSHNNQLGRNTLQTQFVSDFQALINLQPSLLITVLAKLKAQNDK